MITEENQSITVSNSATQVFLILQMSHPTNFIAMTEEETLILIAELRIALGKVQDEEIRRTAQNERDNAL